ncbi:Transcription initiation factor TFIID subunit 12 [Dipsacomyces acuminosporus]|nr:Transcription initiation factor TFIID subunit 12 [Dipsacomyces acuminosporus]
MPGTPTTGTAGAYKSGSKGKEAQTPAREGGIVLSPAMVQQMRSIIQNHPILKKDADNNVPFTNHMLDLIPVPAEFLTEKIENTAQATSYINAEASKIRAHLAVVKSIKDSVTDPDAKRRLVKEVEALETHIHQVNNFMRSSFHSALSGNPAAQASSFGPKDVTPFKKATLADPLKTPSTPGFFTSAATAGTVPTPTSATVPPSSLSSLHPTSMAAAVAAAKAKQSIGGSGAQSPAIAANPNATHVALSSALAHVATQSTRQSGPVDLDGGSRILSKRKIQELVGEIDPTERLEPEVEDILCDIADEFIESVTSFACQLAKHRKSDTLEAKDLQLHLERNWNIRIPGFASEEIRSVRKVTVPQSHQEKLSAITNTKNLRRFN